MEPILGDAMAAGAVTEFFQSLLLAFVPIFVAVDAIGVLPLYIGLTEGIETAQRRRIVKQSMVTAMAVAVAFIFLGKAIFNLMGISVPDFMVAGGVLLFIISALDIVSGAKPTRMVPEIGVVPIGMPLIVGPAVLTTILMIVDQPGYGLWPTLVATVINIALAGLILLGAERFTRLIGASGSKAVSKVASLILAAIAVMMIRKGIFLIAQGKSC